MTRPYLSVVVPCYDEEGVLGDVHRRLTAACRSVGRPYEIILVNDGSRDRTWPLMRWLAESDPNVVAVNLSRNHGHQLALSAGLLLTRGERVLILDADLQDPPELLPEMLRRMDDGADVVYGRRISRDEETLFKRGTAALFYRVLGALTAVAIPPEAGDFRLISRRALDVLLAMPERHRFIRGMVSWIGFHQEPLPYHRAARSAGTSSYSPHKMLRLALDAITAFSIRPLQFATGLGIIMGLFALASAGYSVVSWAWGHPIGGGTSLVIAMATIGSVQLLALGILGEYVGRIHEQVQGRPLFVIDRIVRGRDGLPVEPAPGSVASGHQASGDREAPEANRVRPPDRLGPRLLTGALEPGGPVGWPDAEILNVPRPILVGLPPSHPPEPIGSFPITPPQSTPDQVSDRRGRPNHPERLDHRDKPTPVEIEWMADDRGQREICDGGEFHGQGALGESTQQSQPCKRDMGGHDPHGEAGQEEVHPRNREDPCHAAEGEPWQDATGRKVGTASCQLPTTVREEEGVSRQYGDPGGHLLRAVPAAAEGEHDDAKGGRELAQEQGRRAAMIPPTQLSP